MRQPPLCLVMKHDDDDRGQRDGKDDATMPNTLPRRCSSFYRCRIRPKCPKSVYSRRGCPQETVMPTTMRTTHGFHCAERVNNSTQPGGDHIRKKKSKLPRTHRKKKRVEHGYMVPISIITRSRGHCHLIQTDLIPAFERLAITPPGA